MQVQTVDSGMAGLQLLQNEHFDAIYMQLPGADGLATVKMLRAGDSGNNKTPIIALTEEPVESNLVSCEQAVIEGCISKPISKQALIDETVRVLGLEAALTNVVQPINKNTASRIKHHT